MNSILRMQLVGAIVAVVFGSNALAQSTAVAGTFDANKISYAVPATQQPSSTPMTVDCNKGQSLNQTLAKLNPQTPYTVSVNGTCTEFVQVIGFRNLVLKGLPGATLVQPSTGGGNLLNSTLFIESSQSVQVEGSPFKGTLAHCPISRSGTAVPISACAL